MQLLRVPQLHFATREFVLREIGYVNSILGSRRSRDQAFSFRFEQRAPQCLGEALEPCSCTLRQSSRRNSSSDTSSAFSVSTLVRSTTRESDTSAATTRRGSRKRIRQVRVVRVRFGFSQGNEIISAAVHGVKGHDRIPASSVAIASFP